MKPRHLSPTPYLDTWLRRTRKQLTSSGKLAQVATLLASQDGCAAAVWEEKIRDILSGETTPEIDILIRIDAILAGTPKPGQSPADGQLDFF